MEQCLVSCESVLSNLVFILKSTGESLFSRHYMTYVTFALVGQGIEYPKMNYTRLICVIWLFSALILNTAYVSKLTVQLAFPVIPVSLTA